MSSRRHGSDGEPPKSGWKGTLSKALTSGSDWSDKDEILDVIYWGRQAVALLIGIIFGVVPVNGIIGLGGYVAISTVVIHQFVVKYQKLDEDYLGGFWELAKEGFGAAFATFMVSWITVYSALYFNN
ncbi:unnamed protein product, partial [Mesorhabditis belari]|uniref:Rab5-interacting protein n=1 Tax=Mesorhabditis belari TaxID=2138241 RepID=A0AAF3EW91_9BILA